MEHKKYELKELRQMSIPKLAKIAGVSYSTLKMHSEGAVPTRRIYKKYIEAFGFPLGEVVSGGSRAGFIYVAKNEFGLVKIGATTRTVEARVKQIESLSGVKFLEYAGMESCLPFLAERKIHKEFDGKRAVGEFFNVGIEEAFWVAKEVCDDQYMSLIGKDAPGFKRRHRGKEEVASVIRHHGGFSAVASILGVSRQAVHQYSLGKSYPKKDSEAYAIFESMCDDFNSVDTSIVEQKTNAVQLKLI